MDIKEAAHTDAAAPTDAGSTIGGSVARRRVLAAGISGTALSLLPFLGGRANASGRNDPSTAASDPTGGSTQSGASIPPGNGYNATGDSMNSGSQDTVGITAGSTGGATASTDAATTTTAPPKRPTAEDAVLLSFGQSLELTIRNLYDEAIKAGTFDGATLEAVKAIREAHEAYGQALSGLLGRAAPNAPVDALFTSMQGDFSGNVKDVATAARALENTAVATHLDIVGQLVGVDGSALVASIAIVEARHATVLATLAGVTDLAQELTSDGKPLSPSDYAK